MVVMIVELFFFYMMMMINNIDIPMVSIEGITPALTLLKMAIFYYSSLGACF